MAFEWKNLMKTLMLAAAVSLIVAAPMASSFAAEPMSPEECDKMFVGYDVNNDGSIGPKEGTFYQIRQSSGGSKKDSTGITTKESFMDTCVKGGYRS